MSQYKSSMFSDAVYLFGTTFSSAPSWPDFLEEELPDGTRVAQKKLAQQAVLAAFAYLYQKKFIDIVLVERKFLFFSKTKTAIVKKLQSSAPGTSGLESVLFAHSCDESGIYWNTRELFRSDVDNPWSDVLQIVKRNLLERGQLKQVEKWRVLFITAYKNVVNADISKEEKQVTELKKTLEELQSKGELYESILTAIADGLASRRRFE